MAIEKLVVRMCLLCLMSLVLYGCGDSTPIISEPSREAVSQKKQKEKIRIEPELSKQEKESIQRFGHKYGLAEPKKVQRPRISLSQDEWLAINADERLMENNMNRSGYKTYCTTLLNEQGTIDIVMTSGSFKNSASREAIDNYIGAAVACVGKITSNAKWESRKLIIKVDFEKWYEITTADCRKTVELWNNARGVIEYVKISDYMFAHLREIKK